MGKHANYKQLHSTPDRLVLRDLGPWDEYLTITNDAEHVIKEVLPILHGRRLFYYDSEGELTELHIKDGKLFGFSCGRR